MGIRAVYVLHHRWHFPCTALPAAWGSRRRAIGSRKLRYTERAEAPRLAHRSLRRPGSGS